MAATAVVVVILTHCFCCCCARFAGCFYRVKRVVVIVVYAIMQNVTANRRQ